MSKLVALTSYTGLRVTGQIMHVGTNSRDSRLKERVIPLDLVFERREFNG